jgi:hypothetical protein
MAISNSFGQSSTFEALSDKMFFNITAYKPDTSVLDFVRKYCPLFLEKPEPGGWTIYPPGPPPKLDYTVHSLKFTKHPYFDVSLREGRLDILASEEKIGPPRPSDLQLWFMFDTKADAEAAFTKLSNMFDPISKSKRTSKHDNNSVAEFSDTNPFDEINSVQLILVNDEFHHKKYKLFFRIGSFTYSDSQ